ncbi:unnamed protein product [Arctogadus glacialis]
MSQQPVSSSRRCPQSCFAMKVNALRCTGVGEREQSWRESASRTSEQGSEAVCSCHEAAGAVMSGHIKALSADYSVPAGGAGEGGRRVSESPTAGSTLRRSTGTSFS